VNYWSTDLKSSCPQLLNVTRDTDEINVPTYAFGDMVLKINEDGG